MSGAAVPRERLTRVAPLGVRLWDPATGTPAGAGLDVRCNGARTAVNRSGIHVFSGFPGRRAVEQGHGDDAFWARHAGTATAEVTVDDPHGRFLACRFTIDVPHRGLAGLRCGSPPEVASGRVDLYSAPGRPTVPAVAVIRADLWNAATRAPAAGALLVATPPGGPAARGLADERGSVAIFMPWPAPPAAVEPRPFANERWPVRLEARYRPRPRPERRPDLCEALAQPTATLLAGTSPAVPLADVTLEYGRELVVRSERQSVLVLIPATQ